MTLTYKDIKKVPAVMWPNFSVELGLIKPSPATQLSLPSLWMLQLTINVLIPL